MLLRRALWALPLFAIATHSQAYGEIDDSFHPPSVTGVICSNQDSQLVIDNGYMFKTTRGQLSGPNGILKFRPDGTTDARWGVQGVAAVSEMPGTWVDLLAAADGGLWVIDNKIIRLTASGAHDESFGTHGVIDLTDGAPISTSLQADGSLVAMFFTEAGGYFLRRYDAHGPKSKLSISLTRHERRVRVVAAVGRQCRSGKLPC